MILRKIPRSIMCIAAVSGVTAPRSLLGISICHVCSYCEFHQLHQLPLLYKYHNHHTHFSPETKTVPTVSLTVCYQSLSFHLIITHYNLHLLFSIYCDVFKFINLKKSVIKNPPKKPVTENVVYYKRII